MKDGWEGFTLALWMLVAAGALIHRHRQVAGLMEVLRADLRL